MKLVRLLRAAQNLVRCAKTPMQAPLGQTIPDLSNDISTGAVNNLSWPRTTLFALIVCSLAMSGCSTMGARYLKLGLPVVYENADTLIGWQADQYFDLTNEQSAWLSEQVVQQQAWHRRTQLPRYAATLGGISATAAERNIVAADLDSMQVKVRGWIDDMSQQGIGVMADLFMRVSDQQIAHFRSKIEELNAKTADQNAETSPEEKRETVVDSMVDRYEDMIGTLSPSQLAAINRTATALLPEGEHRLAYWRRWQGELFGLLARRRATPSCFSAQLARMAGNRERWYTPELRHIRSQNEQLQQDLAVTILTNLSAVQRRKFAQRAGEWSQLFASLARKGANDIAQAQPAAFNNSCSDAAVTTQGVVAAGT